MHKRYKTIIIGGGAAGLMFAANLKNKKETLIIEHNSKLGAKILISGGGRCNFTNKNVTTAHYLGDSSFIQTSLKNFSSKWVYRYFTKRGIEASVKNGSEYFCNKSASQLLQVLTKEIRGVELALNSEVLSVTKENGLFTIKSSRGIFIAESLIVASGGLSFPKVGASPVGFEIAKSFGHTIVAPTAALVGFTLQKPQSFFKSLSGSSIDVTLRVAKREINGSMLFAHRGLSGPAILNASLFWQKGHIEIDFLPQFDLRVLKSSSKLLSNLLPLPKRVAVALLEHIEVADKKVSTLSSREWERLEQLKGYTFAPAGTFGFSKAEVTKGGVCTSEVESSTFMSKRVENLYFVGEVLDVTGMLGGYNFQWAFASALQCAKAFN